MESNRPKGTFRLCDLFSIPAGGYFIRDEIMPQGRIVLKTISESKKLPALKSDGARLLYTWLIPHVDVNGCFSADPEIVKGKVFTKLRKTTKSITTYLQDLANIGLIILYNVNGEYYLQLPDFIDKQPSLTPSKEAKPTIPLPTSELLWSNSEGTLLKVKESKVKESKGKYKDFVFLSPSEYQKLIEQLGKEKTTDLIDDLNNYLGSKGRKYKSHYHVILKWSKDDTGTQNSKPHSSENRRASFADQKSNYGTTLED